MTDPYAEVRTRPTDRDRMVTNTAGGHAFAVSDVTRLERFLILGSDSPTYYATARTLTAENAAVVVDMAKRGDLELLATIIDVSLNGRAKNQKPTLLALAIACASPDDTLRRMSLDAVPRIARTFTMLADFLTYVEAQRGWGPALRRAVGSWFTTQDAASLAYGAVKYRQRDGWTQRDALRLAHPHPSDMSLGVRAVIDWITHGTPLPDSNEVPAGYTETQVDDLARAATTIEAHEHVMRPDTPPESIRAVTAVAQLPWEALPTSAHNDPDLWRQMIPTMPLGALIRNLTRFAKLGVTGPTSGDPMAKVIASRFGDLAALRKSRLHPLAILFAWRMYSGAPRNARGWYVRDVKDTTHTPNPTVAAALEKAFYASFPNVAPSGGRVLIALDISGSMDQLFDAKVPLTVREAACAMALVTARVEEDFNVVAFSDGHGARNDFSRTSDILTPLPFGPSTTLGEATAYTAQLPMNGTDCALPFIWAAKQGTAYDGFAVYTDNETWAGRIDPHQALKDYRLKLRKPQARSVVVGMTATNFSIADPEDPGMLDVVGFDAGAASVIGDFLRVDP